MSDYKPKTELGKRLLAIREKAIASGMELLPEDEICGADAEIARLKAALDAERGKVEKVREWMTESGFCSAPYCKKCVIKLEQILK